MELVDIHQFFKQIRYIRNTFSIRSIARVDIEGTVLNALCPIGKNLYGISFVCLALIYITICNCKCHCIVFDKFCIFALTKEHGRTVHYHSICFAIALKEVFNFLFQCTTLGRVSAYSCYNIKLISSCAWIICLFDFAVEVRKCGISKRVTKP